MITIPSVDNNETVVRILHKEWVVDGQLQITAFVLRQSESCISVNRPAIETFLQKVQHQLLALSTVEEHEINP